MGISPGVGSWITQNTQQSPKAESRNLESKPVSESNYHEDREETKKQLKRWRASEKKNPWHDHPPKLKVKTDKKGECHLNMQYTIGLPPAIVFDIFTSHDNQTYSYFPIMKRRKILVNISKTVSSDNGPLEKIVLVEKEANWKFLWWSGSIPIHLSFNENRKDFTTLYTIAKEKKFMKMFSGKWKIEPWYINRQGLIGSKITLDQVFQPSTIFNLPPLSWYIRRVIIKATKTLVQDYQIRGAVIRSV